MIVLTAIVGVIGFSLGFGAGKGDNTMGLVVFNWALIFTSASFGLGFGAVRELMRSLQLSPRLLLEGAKEC